MQPHCQRDSSQGQQHGVVAFLVSAQLSTAARAHLRPLGVDAWLSTAVGVSTRVAGDSLVIRRVGSPFAPRTTAVIMLECVVCRQAHRLSASLAVLNVISPARKADLVRPA